MSVALLVQAGVVWVFAGALVIAGYSKCPYWDQWTIPDYLATHSHISIQWLWSQHNEHRAVFPRLFIAEDILHFGGRNVSTLAAIFLVQTVHSLLLSRYMHRNIHADPILGRSVLALFGIFMFLPNQLENFTWAFQIGFVLSFLFISCSLISFCIYECNRRPIWLVLSCVCPLLASMNLAAGNIAWPGLLLLSLFLRARLKTVICLVLSGTASIILYFHQFHFSQPTADNVTGRSAVALLRYLMTYFGVSWWPVIPHEARAITLLSFLLLGYFIVRASFDKRHFSVPELLLIAECACIFVTASATAVGRMSLGIAQASQSRYQTPALIFWASLICLVLIRLRKHPRKSRFVALQIVLVAVVVKFAFDAPNTWRINSNRADELNRACQAFVQGRLEDRDKKVLCEPCDPKIFGRTWPVLQNAWKVAAGNE